MSSRVATLPNLLTVVRMVITPIFVTCLFYGRFGWGLTLFVFAGITDLLDGRLARRYNQNSDLGRILDPIADKLLLVASFVVLSLPSILPPPVPRHFPIPFWVTAAVISRDIFIVVGSAAINIVTGFRGFRPSMLGKINTLVQVFAIGIVLIVTQVPILGGYVLPTVYTTVFAFALCSGVHYVFHAASLLNEDKRQSDSTTT